MGVQNRIEANQRNGNLHIKVYGYFSQETAGEVVSLVSHVYTGQGNVFIHTKGLTRVDPFAKYIFSSHLKQIRVPCERVYLTGEKGMEISHDAARVIVQPAKKKRCGGCGSRQCGIKNK
ncbi:hypothetical protein [Desulfogranum japonicum]|uniref:hypothetical protein n=1 Tax=Desulfogranum japonicum TaxID=231447 RepID=UPI000420CB97|nr:hypothetical protein [Desulfogranum japonicum]